MEIANKQLEFMESMRQYDHDPSVDEETSKDKPKGDPVVDLFADDDVDDRNSKCMFTFHSYSQGMLKLSLK